MTDECCEQIAFDPSDIEFADNAEPRAPCLLLLDVSGSMRGNPIAELNAGLATFRDELQWDSLAMKRVELEIVTFGPVRTELPFSGASSFVPPVLSARGDTPTGAAIVQGITDIRRRKDEYRSNGIPYFRPWIFCITDGRPTDEWRRAAEAIREGEASKAFSFFAVGVKDADMDTLRQLSVREPLRLEGLKFRELFRWLSASLRSVSRSTPGTQGLLPAPSGWGSV